MVSLAVALDLGAAAFGLALASPLRYDAEAIIRSLTSPAGVALTFLGCLAWLSSLSARGAYRPGVLVSRSEQVVRVVSAAALAWLLVHLLAVWLKVAVPFESRLVMGLSLPATLALIVGARLLAVRPLAALVHRRLFRGPVLFVGDSDRARELASEFEEKDARGRRVSYHPLSGFTPGRAVSLVCEQEYGEVVILPQRGQVAESMEIAFACLDAGTDATLHSPELRLVSEGASGGTFDETPCIRLHRLDYAGPERFFKHLVDFVGAGVGLLLLSPFLAVLAVAVKLSSRGPVIYKQERVGHRGQRFLMYKFRTMKDGNDPRDYQEYLRTFIRDGTPASVAEDGTKIYKPPRDPRVTRVGGWLRRLSFDELPQLWNVMRGEMSLVGPRPCLPYEWDLYDPWQRRRLDVLPGCTGLWQVRGRSRVTFDEMVLLDLYYAHRATLFTDARLIAQTIPVMLLGRGAY